MFLLLMSQYDFEPFGCILTLYDKIKQGSMILWFDFLISVFYMKNNTIIFVCFFELKNVF